ncbi:MAG: CopG family transcriptional regulator [Planctomycetota bacterium]
MHKIFPVTFRCDLVERDRIERAARSAGLSTSEFIRRAALAAIPRSSPRMPPQDTPRAPLRRARVATVQDIKPFRSPFVHGIEGLGYERVVQHAARQMHMDQCSVAMLLTHVVDAIADQMAVGQVVSGPACSSRDPTSTSVVTVAETSSRASGRTAIEPDRGRVMPTGTRCKRGARQPPEERAPSGRAARSRSDGSGPSAIVNQDLRALRVVEAIWREESPAHAI